MSALYKRLDCEGSIRTVHLHDVSLFCKRFLWRSMRVSSAQYRSDESSIGRFMSDCDSSNSETNKAPSSQNGERDLLESLLSDLSPQQWRQLITIAQCLNRDAPLMISKRQHALLSSIYTAMTQGELDEFGEGHEFHKAELNIEGEPADRSHLDVSLSTETVVCLFATLIECIPADAPQERAAQLDRAVDLIAMLEVAHARSARDRDELKGLIKTYIRRLRGSLIDRLINDIPPALRVSVRAYLSII